MEYVETLGGGSTTVALQIAVAVALLMLGRRLYWLFVAGIGFVVAMDLATTYLGGSGEWVTLAIGIVAGLAGALFAIFLQRLAVGIAGFAALAYFAAHISARFLLDDRVELLVVVVAGIIGAVFASVLFDWALILLSSIVGAAMLVDTFALQDPVGLVVMAVVAIAGVSIQANFMHRDKDD